MYAYLTSITKGSWNTVFRHRGLKITFKACTCFKFRLTSDIHSKVIGQPGQDADEIGRPSVRREDGDSQNIIVRPEITTKTCSPREAYTWRPPGSTISEDWTYNPYSHM